MSEPIEDRAGNRDATHAADSPGGRDGAAHPALAALLWLWVLVPFGYGVYQLVVKIPALFGS